MNTYEMNNAPCLGKLANALRKAPETWVKWSAIHIDTGAKKVPASYPEIQLRSAIQLATNNLNSNSYLLEDGNILLIVRSLPVARLRCLAVELVGILRTNCNLHASYKLYHLDGDYQKFALFCEEKSKALHLQEVSNPEAFKTMEEAKEIFELYPIQQYKSEERTHKKVLVVEDDPLTRRIVGKILYDQVELVTAQDAHEAIVSYILHRPDVVFMDIGLPGKDGKTVMRTLLDYDPNANIVMFSANHYMDNIVETINSGASGFVSKPFREDQLMYYIDKGKAV